MHEDRDIWWQRWDPQYEVNGKSRVGVELGIYESVKYFVPYQGTGFQTQGHLSWVEGAQIAMSQSTLVL